MNMKTLLLALFLVPCAAHAQVRFSIENNAALQALSTAGATFAVIRQGFTAAGDAPPLTFIPSNSACSLNSGNGDNGAQVKSADGKCWIASFPVPDLDVRQWGFVDSATADNTAPINKALSYACTVVSGAVVRIPNVINWIKTTAALTLTCTGVELVGPGQSATIAPVDTSFDTVVASSQGNSIRNLRIIPSSVGAVEHYAIKCSGTNRCLVDNVQIVSPFSGIYTNGNFTDLRGFQITGAKASTGRGVVVDKPTSGDSVTVISRCVMQNAAGSDAYAGVWVAPGVSTVDVSLCNIIHMGAALDVTSTTGQITSSIVVGQSYLDNSSRYGLVLEPGGGTIQRVRVNNAWVASSVLNNIRFVGTGTVAGFVMTNYQNFGSGGHGIQIDSTVTTNSISFCNGINAGNAAAGIYIDAGVSDVEVCDGKFGAAAGWGNNTYPIYIAAGAGDYLKIHDNTLLDGTVANLFNGATGTHNRIVDNPGYNPGGPLAVTVGASPWTYTAGASPETHYINAGTVSAIQLGSTTVFTTTPATINLGPNESYTVVYTSAPTVVKRMH